MTTRTSAHLAVLLAVSMTAALALAACGPTEAPAKRTLVTVYKSPTCECCSRWVQHMRDAGFEVEVHNESALDAVKEKLGVPEGLASCHTATVNGYVLEGHVPAADVKRLLAERPAARGLAVPGMPLGSPGMEVGDRKDAYEVLLFAESGAPQAFASHGP